jgi:hypothetical protein
MILTTLPGSHSPDRDEPGPLKAVVARVKLIIGAPHRAYRGRRLPEAKPVIDIWNIHGQGAFPT